MKASEIKKALDNLNIDPKKISDQALRTSFILLFNLVEKTLAENETQKNEIQQLKDEISKLKGEQGKPTIRPQKKKDGDVSSEKERKNKKKKKKKNKSKNHKIEINRTVSLEIEKTELPNDLIFKGYETVIVQDLVIGVDNVAFKKEVYYSLSLNKTFMAPMPIGYQGEFGPSIRALTKSLYHSGQMTEPKILEFLQNFGVQISSASISRILTNSNEAFHEEKSEIFRAGLESTDYQHIDDTGSRVEGKNHFTHVVCNPFYTAYFTEPNKDRLTIIDILSGKNTKVFRLDAFAYNLMEIFKVPVKWIDRLKAFNSETILTEEKIQSLLKDLFANAKTPHPQHCKRIMEACGISAYRQMDNFPIVRDVEKNKSPKTLVN